MWMLHRRSGRIEIFLQTRKCDVATRQIANPSQMLPADAAGFSFLHEVCDIGSFELCRLMKKSSHHSPGRLLKPFRIDGTFYRGREAAQ